MIQKQRLIKLLIPLLYTAAILALVLYQWSEQMMGWFSGNSPLYRNLMEAPAYVRRGFNPLELHDIPSGEAWFTFTSSPLRIKNSPLPGLPERNFLYPRGKPAEEFTIIIPLELDRRALTAGMEPGIFLGYIGENWEVYLNGRLVQREMHLRGSGHIGSRRNWRAVHFPVDISLLHEGTNILAFRIVGDPTLGLTGMYYASPYYLDDYSLIKRRHLDILELILCGIFGYTGIYYMIIFLSIRKKQELYNLYYSLFSILLCVYTLMRTGIVNYLIPNSDISIRLEFLSLFMMVPILSLFIEHFGRQNISKITWGFLFFYCLLSLTQIFFSTQYGADVLMIWSATVFIYFSYIFFYNILYVYYKQRKENVKDSFFVHIVIGSVLVYLCGLYDVLDVIFFHSSSGLFLYSTFVFHIGMAITLSQRYREMYRQMEHSNIILEEKVYERTQTAMEASRAKSNFFANMSHEIRTPLNAVIGFSEIELRGDLSPSTRESFSHIHRSGSFLLEIINEILDISKIESGRLDLVTGEYDTLQLLSSVTCQNKLTIEEKSMLKPGARPIQLILKIENPFPASLIGDELRVRQILNNLLSNAIKYTEQGSIMLTVKSEELAKTPVYSSVCPLLITFAVSDTGIGIAPQDMGKLFDNYAQLDTKANRKSEGTGLGLAIVRNLAEMMGGSVSVESKYGSGSCFTASIMQELPHMDKGQAAPYMEEQAREALENFRYDIYCREISIRPLDKQEEPKISGSILIVDDIPENLLVVKKFLEPYGLEIDTASSGGEAIEKVKNKGYDLILMDHMMPEMDGVETLKAIRAIEKEILNQPDGVPVVVLTSNALRGMNEFYKEHGFIDYLAKPVNQKQLNEVIRRFLKPEAAPPDNKDETLALGNNVLLSANFSAELDSRRLDRLKHFCFAFESGREIDTEYFLKFTSFMESLDSLLSSPSLKEQAALLIRAGHDNDAKTVIRALPAFYRSMESHLEAADSGQSVKEMVEEIKGALIKGDTKTINQTCKKLGAIKLIPLDRELYFKLYEASMLDNNKEALKAISQWEKERGND